MKKVIIGASANQATTFYSNGTIRTILTPAVQAVAEVKDEKGKVTTKAVEAKDATFKDEILHTSGKFSVKGADGKHIEIDTTTLPASEFQDLAEGESFPLNEAQKDAVKLVHSLAAALESVNAKITGTDDSELNALKETASAATSAKTDFFAEFQDKLDVSENMAKFKKLRAAETAAQKAITDYTPTVNPTDEFYYSLVAPLSKSFNRAKGSKKAASSTSSTSSPASDAPTTGNFTYLQATGTATATGFIVKAGSAINADIAPSAPKGTKDAREANKALISGGKITKDITFNSWSAAACFVAGSSKSGAASWKAATA